MSQRIIVLTIGLLLVSLLASVAVRPAGAPGPAGASGPNPPRGIHLSYLNNPETAVLTWHTTSSSTSRADWGVVSGGPYPNSATGTNYVSPGGSFLHTVTLTGLNPGARYYYRVGDTGMASSYGEASFRAALPNGSTESFSFAAAGDWSNSSGSAATSNGIQARDPNLVLPLGDNYYSDKETDVKGVWEKWQAFGQGSLVQTVVGNHEYAGDSKQTPTPVHCAFVNQPGNERTYSFKFGNTLFLAIDWGENPGSTTDGVDATGSACGGAAGTNKIRTWLNASLAAANLDHDIRWKVVLQHFQCYDMTTSPYTLLCPDGSKPSDQEEDILNYRGVDLVLFGHDHTYGRTHPVRFHTRVQSGSSYDTPGAPMYFDLGTGGAASTSGCRTDSWVASCRAPISTLGFGHFRVSPTTIQYEFIDNTAGVVDSFTLTKRPATDYALSVEPVSGRTIRSAVMTAPVSVLGASVGPVALSVSGCPAFTLCTLSPPSGSPSFSSTLRVETGPSSPYGTSDLVITGTNATVSRSVTFHLTISDRLSLSYRKGDGGAFSETDDTYITNGSANTNFGTSPTLLVDGKDCVGSNTGTVCKTLIKFPSFIGPSAGQIPSGSRIVNATLELNIKNKGDPQDAYYVTEAWSESLATWNTFATPGIPGNRGKEFTFLTNFFGKLSLNITSIAQRWANGDVNQGLLFASTNGDGVDYNSSESASNKPNLRVEFVPPVPPPTVAHPPIAIYSNSDFTTANGVRSGDGSAQNPYIISDWTFDGTLYPTSVAMVWIQGTDRYAIIRNVTITNLNQAQQWFGILLGTNVYPVITPIPTSHIAVVDSHISTRHAYGIQASEGAQDIRIAGNHVSVDADHDWVYGIVAQRGTHDVLIEGNIVSAPSHVHITVGIHLSDFYVSDARMATGLVARSNTITDAASGIQVESSLTSRVEDNLITRADMQSVGGTGYPRGITIRDRAAGARIENNTIRTQDSGITIALASDDVRVQRNNIADADVGMRVGNVSELRIVSNQISARLYTFYLGEEFGSPSRVSVENHLVPFRVLAPVSVTLHLTWSGLVPNSRYVVTRNGTNNTQFTTDATGSGSANVSSGLGITDIGRIGPLGPPGPVLSYDMETVLPDGRMKDLSGNANHGAITGTSDLAGKIGRARHFNGGDRITAPPNPVPDLNFTVAAWFNWTTNPSPFYSGIHGGGISWELRVQNDGRFAAVFYQSIGPDIPTDVTTSLAYNDGTWHHVATVLRNGLVELHVDGALVAQDTTNPITTVRTSALTEIGHVASDFIGDIDEVRVFTRALSSAEIAALAPPPPPPVDGLVLSYDMESLTTAGRMKDLSGQERHGTLTGTTDVLGKVGRARHFNDGEGMVAAAISVPATNFTVAAWFNWTTNPSPYYGGIQGGGNSWEIRVQSDGRFAIVFYQATGPDVATYVTSSMGYNDGTWHHVAGVLRNGLAELYVDGALASQVTTNPLTSVRTSTLTYIGHVASDFIGDIDEVRVFTRALSSAEIAALAPPPPPPVDGLVLAYDMETILPDGRMKDLSGQGTHGTIAGATDVLGRIGRARYFNGNGDVISAPAISIPALNFTIAAWFNWTSDPSPFYSGIHGGGLSWELRVMADGRLSAVFYESISPDVYTAVVSPLTYNDATWHHAAAVLRNGLAELYVDGALVAFDTTDPISAVRSSTGIQIGLVASNFNGSTDEVRIFILALTSQQIAALASGSINDVQYSIAGEPLGVLVPFAVRWGILMCRAASSGVTMATSWDSKRSMIPQFSEGYTVARAQRVIGHCLGTLPLPSRA